ncbi:hypothetical protein O181_065306 [Austropuccinia psidii MF-1]|uniref:ribonuclease H n=1 Tax=Austropuccinia psidii MF-1 TaxID=1389203 RepID=A0A9Q3EVD7_9BASI|nr:hypothetical protein [Austropuccinia psidii MF-1]
MINKDFLRIQHTTPSETRTPHTLPPWEIPLQRAENLGIPKKKAALKIKTQLQGKVMNDSLILFTDGSLTEGQKAGVTVYAPYKDLELRVHLGQGKNMTNYEAELTEIWYAAATAHTMLHATPSRRNKVAIFSDSQAALNAIRKPNEKCKAQHLCLKIYKLLSNVKERSNLSLYWCPGHSDVLENKEVDNLAKQAADNHPTSVQETLPQILSRLHKNTKAETMGPTQIIDPKNRYPFSSDPGKLQEALAMWDRGAATLFYQLRSGHVPLNRQQRMALRQGLVKKKVRVNFDNHYQPLDSVKAIPEIMKYITNTNRFPMHMTRHQVTPNRGQPASLSQSQRERTRRPETPLRAR